MAEPVVVMKPPARGATVAVWADDDASVSGESGT
jgi:hypothetical protein